MKCSECNTSYFLDVKCQKCESLNQDINDKFLSVFTILLFYQKIHKTVHEEGRLMTIDARSMNIIGGALGDIYPLLNVAGHVIQMYGAFHEEPYISELGTNINKVMDFIIAAKDKDIPPEILGVAIDKTMEFTGIENNPLFGMLVSKGNPDLH